ncbi:MAG: hypothetical protein AB8B55_09125 [Mariniblastus sp.]
MPEPNAPNNFNDGIQKPKKIVAKSFTFLSWNLCMLENSAAAPSGWRMDQAESKVREFILELAPDFVFFQELPGLVPYVETHDLIPANTISHCGNIATIVRKDLMDQLTSKALGKFGVLTNFEAAGISFCNVHLEPGKTGDDKRLGSVNRITQETTTPGLIVVGDTNTRISEEKSFEEIGLIGERPRKATWDSRKNRFRENGREYTAYYTRFFHNEQVKIDKVKIWDEPIVEDNRRFHLSDHFPISGRATFVGGEKAV